MLQTSFRGHMTSYSMQMKRLCERFTACSTRFPLSQFTKFIGTFFLFDKIQSVVATYILRSSASVSAWVPNRDHRKMFSWHEWLLVLYFPQLYIYTFTAKASLAVRAANWRDLKVFSSTERKMKWRRWERNAKSEKKKKIVCTCGRAKAWTRCLHAVIGSVLTRSRGFCGCMLIRC